MKRVIVIIILLLIVLTACVTMDKSNQPRILINTLAHKFNDKDDADWMRIVDEFEKMNPDIAIKYEMVLHKDYPEIARKRINSGNIPDLSLQLPSQDMD